MLVCTIKTTQNSMLLERIIFGKVIYNMRKKVFDISVITKSIGARAFGRSELEHVCKYVQGSVATT